jgi:hypothetical protein
MIIISVAQLSKLSKEELWEVALERANSLEVQNTALELWLMLDDRDYMDSISRMRELINNAKKFMLGQSDVHASRRRLDDLRNSRAKNQKGD